ncbi:MAG: hypothetical protein E7404_02115 [Ruminococcaceae bacterium]|nr:hypothetical protein [Oscillospiraceae bacterium]
MSTNSVYLSYNNYFLDYNKDSFIMCVGYGKKYFTAKIKSDILNGFDKCEDTYILENLGVVKKVTYYNKEKTLLITFKADKNGITVLADADIEGVFEYDDSYNILPMRLDKRTHVTRTSLGNGVSKYDNALFDRNQDSAVIIDGSDINFGFDFEKNNYTLFGKCEFTFLFKKDIYAHNFCVPYGKINKNNTFGKMPPVGWMTWYAVKFDAGEKTVLENAKFMSDNLKDFGANTLWVDWEWYHKGFYAASEPLHYVYLQPGPRDDGVDTFNPDKQKYPNGLKYVSDKIKEFGLIPSLWIGFTNETWETDYIKEHPEIVLCENPSWVGIYFYDITHPTYLNDFLPKAMAKVKEWGYDAIKFDTLPICMEMCEKHHEKLYDKSLTTFEAYRNMIKKVRELAGDDTYMLSCAGDNHAVVTWAGDMFDAARVGLDIFEWEEFLHNCAFRAMEFYPMHNVMMYNDPDNVLVREEYNTLNQAISRAVFVSMLGMPVTFGDDLTKLPKERVDVLKRVIPSLDITPKDAISRVDKTKIFITNLVVNKKWENYNVVSLFNTTEEKQQYEVDFDNELELEKGKYHIYDYWNDKYLGIFEDKLNLDFDECETKVLAIRKACDIPQIVSTSRHITQGAAEIEDTFFKDNVLYLEANLVKNDEYKVALFVPDNYKIKDSGKFNVKYEGDIAYLTFTPDATQKYKFEIKF